MVFVKNKDQSKLIKTEATFQIGIYKTQLFNFIIFFLFQSGSPPKWPKCVQKGSKYNFEQLITVIAPLNVVGSLRKLVRLLSGC